MESIHAMSSYSTVIYILHDEYVLHYMTTEGWYKGRTVEVARMMSVLTTQSTVESSVCDIQRTQ